MGGKYEDLPVKKLFTLKKWLTLPETARHLSIVFGENVSEADVLRLALDGHLKLSVNFVNHAKAIRGKVIPFEDAKYDDFPIEFLSLRPIAEEHKGKSVKVLRGVNLDDKRVWERDDDVVTLDGVYELAMVGSERLDLEHKYQMLTDGPSVTLQGVDGAFVSSATDTMYQILENYEENEYQSGSKAHLKALEAQIAIEKIRPPKAQEMLAQHKVARKKFLEEAKERRDSGKDSDNYYPAGGLPVDSVLVVRTDSLRDFEQSINATPEATEKPTTTTERNTLLTIIAALCDYSAIDPAGRGTATQIAGMTEELGAAVTDDTIRTVLKKIPDALERRTK